MTTTLYPCCRCCGVLDAVAPAIAARTLREAADEWTETYGHGARYYRHTDITRWLRARADQIDPMPDTFAGTEWEKR